MIHIACTSSEGNCRAYTATPGTTVKPLYLLNSTSWLDLYNAYYLSNCQNLDSHFILHSGAYILISQFTLRRQFLACIYHAILRCRIHRKKHGYYKTLYTEGLGGTDWMRIRQILCAQTFALLRPLKTGRKNVVFWEVTPRGSCKNRGNVSPPSLIRLRQNILPKRRFLLDRHCGTPQKTTFFTVTAVRTSNLT
jgi:hypothetical protein